MTEEKIRTYDKLEDGEKKCLMFQTNETNSGLQQIQIIQIQIGLKKNVILLL